MKNDVIPPGEYVRLMANVPALAANFKHLMELEAKKNALQKELMVAVAYRLAQSILEVLNRRRPGSNYRLRSFKERPSYWPVKRRIRRSGTDEFYEIQTTADKVSDWAQDTLITPFNKYQVGWFEIDRNVLDDKRIFLTVHDGGMLYINVDTPLPSTEDELLAVLKVPALPAEQVPHGEQTNQPQPPSQDATVRSGRDEAGGRDGENAAE